MSAGRLTIFAKGNTDLRDVLIARRESGMLSWNGINEVIRARFPGWRARVRHETCTRSDALAVATGDVPAGLAALDPLLDAYPAASQFSAAIFDGGHDAVILSLQPDLMTVLARHRADGYLFYPNGYENWDDRRHWLAETFVAEDLLGVDEAMASLAAVIARLRTVSPGPVLVFNVSAAVTGEWIHDHRGLDDTFGTRIRRFNLGLVDLSRETGVSIVDVDALVARDGARRLMTDPLHLNADGCRLVAEEVVRILADLGCFDGGDAP